MGDQSLLLIFFAQVDDKDLPSTCSKNETIEDVVPKRKIPKATKHNQSLNREAYEKMRLVGLLEEIKHQDLHYVYL